MAKGKQLKIAGTASKDRLPDVEKAAAAYVAARDERMENTKVEVKTQAALVAAMQAHKLQSYKCDDEDLLITLTDTGVKAKVKKIGGADEAPAAE